MAPSATNEESRSSSQKSDKKHKREKSEHKKRPREEDEPAAADTTPRKTKKAKSEQKNSQPSKSAEFAVDSASDGEAVTAHVAAPVTPITPTTPATPSTASATKEKKKKKSSSKEKGSKDEDTESKKESKKESKEESKKESKKSKKEDKESKKQDKESKKQDKESKTQDKESKKQDKESKKQDKESKKQDKESKKESKESKKDHKKSKKHKRNQQEEETQDVTSTKQVAEADAMEVDIPDLSIRTKDKDRRSKNKMDVAEVPLDPKFPFFRQTISIYVPLFPIGFDKPTTQMAEQHLEPLVNHYSTTIKGLLLNYSNVRVSDRPTESGPSIPTTDTTPTLLVSRDEYGVGFGWLTFDALMFKPARGKWMEGVIQLQSEGYIGVVCWGRFNASIEAKRLPRTWKWIELDKPEGSDAGRDISDGEEGVTQMHTTGYWVDEKGSRIGGKVRFRIKNFDVGLSGDYGYLSIEGTFLDDAAEKALMMEEREEERRRRATVNPTGDLRPQTKPMPAFGVTKFGKDEEEELEDAQARAVYQRSRPVTPDA